MKERRTILVVLEPDVTFTSKDLCFADSLRNLLFLVDILLYYLYALRHFVRFLSDILTKCCLRCTPLFAFQLGDTMHRFSRALGRIKLLNVLKLIEGIIAYLNCLS